MDKRILLYCCIVFALVSCNTEKVNLSPLSGNNDDITGNRYKTTSFEERANQINYASELSNLMSSVPKFTNDAVNSETLKLKEHIKSYISSIQDYNLIHMEKSYNSFQRSYKKLQKLKPYLNQDEAAVLNRYLVRIKTNMNNLEDRQQAKDSVTLN